MELSHNKGVTMQMPKVSLTTAIVTVMMFISLTINVFLGFWITVQQRDIDYLRSRFAPAEQFVGELMEHGKPFNPKEG